MWPWAAKFSSISAKKVNHTGRRGFEPPTPGLRGLQSQNKAVATEIFDLKDFYEEFKPEFEKWLKRKVSDYTAERYLKTLEKYLKKGIKEPKDLDSITHNSKYISMGIRNFLNFLEDQHYMDDLGGYSFSLWRKHLPTKPAKKKGEKIFLTDKHIKEAIELYLEVLQEKELKKTHKAEVVEVIV